METTPILKTAPKKVDTVEKKDELSEIAELIKKEGIGQVVIHGQDHYRDGQKTGDLLFHSDLDARTALLLLNNYNNLSAEKLYAEGATTSIVPTGGSEKNLDYKNTKGVRIFLDVGGEWVKVDKKDGETTTAYIDHHGSGQKSPTSATKMVYDMLDKSRLLKDNPEWLKNFVKFVNDFDNLTYINEKDAEGNKVFNKTYFKHKWPRTIYAMADEIPLEKLLELYKSGKIKDLSKPLTMYEIGEVQADGKMRGGAIGNIVISKTVEKNPKNGQEVVKETTIRDIYEQKKKEAQMTVTGINQAIRYAEENGLNLNTSSLGKIVYQNFPKVRTKDGKIYTNRILKKMGYLGASAMGYDSIVFWDPENKGGDKRFFINSNKPGLSAVGSEVMKLAPETTDVRGVFLFPPKNKEGVQNISQEQFLNIIDTKILENAKVIKGEPQTESTENKFIVEEVEEEPEIVPEEVEERIETKPGEAVDTKELAEKAKNNPEEKTESEIGEEKIKKEIELQTKLGEARAKYAEGYKKFMAERKKNLSFFKGLKRRLLGEKVPEEEVPEELKKLETEYNQAITEYGQNMYNNKSDLLLASGKSAELIQAELEHYKQAEIFDKVIIGEQTELNKLKAENLPPKEKSLWKKAVDSYLRQPRWKKVLISTGLSVAVFAAVAPGTIAAAGGLGAYIVARLTRGAVGSVAGQTAAKMYDWSVKERYTGRKEGALEELKKKFAGKDSVSDMAEYKKEYDAILEREAKSKRNRLLHKAMVGALAGGAASFGAGHEIGHFIGTEGEAAVPVSGNPHDHIPVPGKTNIEEHLFKTEQVQFSSKGAIQTIENLKAKISADYPDLSKAPHSVQEFMRTNSTEEAIKLGFYDPNNTSGAESAMIIKGSTLEFDNHGNLVYHDIRTGEAHNLITEQGSTETVEQYHGKMFDSDHSASSTPEEIPHVSEGGNIDEGLQASQFNPDGTPVMPEEIPHVTEAGIAGGQTPETLAHVGDATHSETPVSVDINKPIIDNPYHLSIDDLQKVNNIYEENVKHLFPTNEGHDAWLEIENSNNTTANHVLNMDEENVFDKYKPLVSYMHKLTEETGLKPREATLLHYAETNKEFIKRALQKAASDPSIGLDKLKL